jgi:hypothetical protein
MLFELRIANACRNPPERLADVPTLAEWLAAGRAQNRAGSQALELLRWGA